MIYNVYSVLDVSVGYGVPVVQDNDAVAMRSFENGCSDPGSVWHTHPADFYLHRIGTFDTSTGELSSCKPARVCSALDFVPRNFVVDEKGDDSIDL